MDLHWTPTQWGQARAEHGEWGRVGQGRGEVGDDWGQMVIGEPGTGANGDEPIRVGGGWGTNGDDRGLWTAIGGQISQGPAIWAWLLGR